MERYIISANGVNVFHSDDLSEVLEEVERLESRYPDVTVFDVEKDRFLFEQRRYRVVRNWKLVAIQ